jgi:phosphatidylinositol 4-kinase
MYLDRCLHSTGAIVQRPSPDIGVANDMEDAVHVATLTMSILGFLDAAATYANFWSSSERLALVERVKAILSENFLVAVETAFSTLRNSNLNNNNVKEWKRYVRHYAAIGRPLGAMLLQRSFMWLLVAGTSLLVADIDVLRGSDILDLLMSGIGIRRPATPRTSEIDFGTIETMADIAADEMSLLEDGADYLRLGSAWQQRLAFSVKAGALTSYLNCAVLNEDAADADTLMSWLEDTLADPIQMADEILASVVLRSMALISKVSPELAPKVSRLLPRFIVQGGTRGQTIAIASTCLAYVLQILSQDAIITTSVVYGNVVQAICGIANACCEPKITALAQSMLLQKINKVNKSIDARIITETTGLALSGGPLEFRSLLKLYARISHEGVLQKNEPLLSAVSFAMQQGCDHSLTVTRL